jgi:hypothetical protein
METGRLLPEHLQLRKEDKVLQLDVPVDAERR